MTRFRGLLLVGIAVAAPAVAQEHQHASPAAVESGGDRAESGLEQGRPTGEIPESPAPPPPGDFAADHFFAPTAMAAARSQLREEHGGERVSSALLRIAEYQGGNDEARYRWDAEAWMGGDVNRLVLKSEGEGAGSGPPEAAELQALFSRAVGVYTDLQFGVRHDFEPSRRSYLAASVQTIFPYWLEVEGSAFLSDAGELLGRVEGSYDARITNRWILQPRIELTAAAKDSPELRFGSGLTIAEFGLRLRYEIRREFAPYVGVSYEKRFAGTARYARASGEEDETMNFVLGVRTFF